MQETPSVFARIAAGEEISIDELLPCVYDELHRIAQQQMNSERRSHTLQPTALVHEAFLKLVSGPNQQLLNSRSYFFAAAATAMRRILVDNARHKRRLRHGGDFQRIELTDQPAFNQDPDQADKLLKLDQALNKLQTEDPQLAKLVELRTFCGLGHEKIAELLDISVYKARQQWSFARAWLKNAIEQSAAEEKK